MNPEIVVEVTDTHLKIFIVGSLHLSFKLKDYKGFQSWISDGENKYKIEYYFNDGNTILTEYDLKTKWVEILKQLNDRL